MSFSLRIFLAFIIIIIVEFYFARRLTASLKTVFPTYPSRKIAGTVKASLLILNIYPVFLLGAWGYSAIAEQPRVQVPESAFFDYIVLYPFWIGILTILQSILVLLPLDLLRLISFPFYEKFRYRIKPYVAKFTLALIVFFIIYVPGRIIYDYNRVSVRVTEYKKTNLPDNLEGLKITFISDIQADRYTDPARLKNYIKKVNSTNPDLVLIAGDIITSTPDYIETAAQYVGRIKSKHGVFSCVGDHDNWAWREDNRKSVSAITAALKKYNVEMIDNDKKVISVGNSKIGITFITNTYVERITDEELEGIANGGKRYDLNIFLTHQPRNYLIDKAVQHNYDLFLAGHTHGGQITFLFPFKNLSPTLFETRYVKGDFWFGEMLAVVTRGLGMSLVPIRYNSTPEVTVIVLNKG